ncbi:aldo/keto reductase [Pseudoflavonifractor sp. 60]|uniref:aldo/keto reductase n=1 Tax=Pseudoflavonifractor sp. 60 TaxID=2304576 RepID=UPI00136F9591|nr:aldo/keto reductase [Pseudoflavonifractor sp. 60]NBI67486.1 aldo/keto reductase [Pseudoflavonifractor sp. 60]
MNYRALGRTGLKVSEIAMGCEGFVDKSYEQVLEFVDKMEELGINCVDLYTSNPEVRANLGRALEGRRDKFILQSHLCSVWENGQYLRTRDINKVRAGFEEMLRLLNTGFIEIGMIHYSDALSDWREIVDGPVMAYAQELKAAGKIGCIGLSSHNPEVGQAAVDSGLVDVLMFSVNPCYDLQPANEDVEQLWAEAAYAHQLVNMDPQRQALYESCQRQGVGITVMKAFGGGDLLSQYSPAGLALTPFQCLHYALTRPGVACVMAGARTAAELEQCAAYEDAPDREKDYAAAFAAMPKISWEGHCMYCGHCAPCPRGIDVASVTKFLNLAKAQGEVPETVREHYSLLPHHAGECVACGTCEKRCPFSVSIIKNMKQAAALFQH